MPQYIVSIDGREYKIEVNGDEIYIDGEPADINLLELNGDGLHLLTREQETMELHLQEQDPETLELLARGRRVIAKVETPQNRLRRRNEESSAGKLLAPMPGLVMEVLATEGDAVENGQSLIVLESMKMQMQIRTSVEGVVAEVAVEPGQQVNKGELLVLVESPEDAQKENDAED